jgi:hypothetical protein
MFCRIAPIDGLVCGDTRRSEGPSALRPMSDRPDRPRRHTGWTPSWPRPAGILQRIDPALAPVCGDHEGDDPMLLAAMLSLPIRQVHRLAVAG